MSSLPVFSPNTQRQVASELGLYVYALVDPRTGVPFYVGKGRGERFASHGWEAVLGQGEESTVDVKAKASQIRDIRANGLEPEVWIVRHGMKSNPEYTAVEAACIDLLHSMPIAPIFQGERRIPEAHMQQLTNARRESSRGHGIMLLDDLVTEKAAPILDIDMPLLTITLGPWTETPWGEAMPGGHIRYGYGYKSEWLTRNERIKNLQQIGESAAGWWRLNPLRVRNQGIQYAVAVHRGVTRALLKIKPNSWVSNGEGHQRRSAFDFDIIEAGDVFEQTVGQYGHRLPSNKRGARNVFYWPRSA